MTEPDRSVVTMSTLGKKGRFGNQIFQFAFLKIYAKVFGLRVETPAWIGQYLFGHKDPTITKTLPRIREEEQTNLGSLFREAEPRYQEVDFYGYYQFHTSVFAPYKDYFQSLFNPTPQIKAQIEQGLAALSARGKTIVGLHLRRGDYKRYRKSNKKDVFYIAPAEWYLKWLKSIWPDLKDPVLFVCSDEIEAVAPKFSEYSPVVSGDLLGSFPRAAFFPDFYFLTKCDILAISNSTFSFTASMLNNKATAFLRPDVNAKKLISYDPWASPPLLNRFRNYY